MRIIPFEVIIAPAFPFDKPTFVIKVMEFDWAYDDTSLLEIGWWQGKFTCDSLLYTFLRGHLRKYWLK